MAWFSRKITVTFIDDATDRVFASSKMTPAKLPDSFLIDTTMHLGDEDWSVISAEPHTKAQFAKSGKLTLRLRKVERLPLKEISFSQLDITEHFDDHQNLGAEDWIDTTPLNTTVENPESVGLPSLGADTDEVYQMASQLSELRESISIPDDGVYCPICNLANIDLTKLRTPCPKCGRELLKFGWT